MFEISESDLKPVDLSTIYEDTIRQAIETKMIPEDADIVSMFHSRVEYGYPVPTVDRFVTAYSERRIATDLDSETRFFKRLFRF